MDSGSLVEIGLVLFVAYGGGSLIRNLATGAFRSLVPERCSSCGGENTLKINKTTGRVINRRRWGSNRRTKSFIQVGATTVEYW